MKKISLFFILSVFFSLKLFSQVKNYIPTVKPMLYEQTKETFENIARKFEQKNYNALAEIFRSFAQGGHGSGFVYVDADGENYIITNRHVVNNSEHVTLEFAGKGSMKTVYEGCPIVYTDDNIDLAVIKFPNNEKVFESSFTLSLEQQKDGNEIWSAGYPGLLGKPMWQFAKGNITNEEAYVDEMVSSDVSYLMQHSASIDPGNSGGPLLIKDEKIADGYSVVGVNTWTITNRQNTFFAIPSKNIPQLIEKAKHINNVKTRKDSIRSMLVKQAKIFAAEINSEKPNWGKVMNYISYSYVGNKGWDSFIRIIEEGDAETLKLVDAKFYNYNPIEAMRFSILYRIWKKLYSNNKITIEYKGINEADEEEFGKGKTARTNFLIDGENQEIEWYFEHGHWRINNYNLERQTKKNQEATTEEEEEEEVVHRKKKYEGPAVFLGLDAHFTPFSQTFDPALNKNFNLMGYGGGLTINFKDRTAIHTRVSTLNLNNEMSNPPDNLSSASVKYFHINHGLTIYITRNKIRPYVFGGFNYFVFSETGTQEEVSVTNKFKRFGLQVGTGLQIKVNKQVGIFAQAIYNCSTVVPILLMDLYTADLSNFQTNVGISFNLRKK